jgi:hypothetical protein
MKVHTWVQFQRQPPPNATTLLQLEFLISKSDVLSMEIKPTRMLKIHPQAPHPTSHLLTQQNRAAQSFIWKVFLSQRNSFRSNSGVARRIFNQHQYPQRSQSVNRERPSRYNHHFRQSSNFRAPRQSTIELNGHHYSKPVNKMTTSVADENLMMTSRVRVVSYLNEYVFPETFSESAQTFKWLEPLELNGHR